MKNIFVLIFICSAVIVTSCKSQKEKQTAEIKEDSAPNNPESKTTLIKSNPENSSSYQEKDYDMSKLKEMKFVSAKENDTIFATIEKTPCFGTCPVYNLMIFQSGLALYNGNLNVDNKGKYLVEFSEEEMKTIREKAIEINYFKLQAEYDSPVTDFPTTRTSIRLNDKVKSVSNRVGGPQELKEFEKHIHETLMQKDFIKISE